ncbi:hypothetical protein KNV77_gp095 [Klebsiella phage vB_KpnP_P184]|uniref:Uncharacterized protein n=1 Tax=Klebsiella phage vB_KpnP_P184 TaxID=2806547 RepID=A0A898KAQ8_9CAUD|nr:hypothetical protein KNV77_gp095 [Klebsiella phage vB_KpnP_P184]QSJ03707.1 hypothetical protein [Klebsiella phage vB_KpnP_P184]
MVFLLQALSGQNSQPGDTGNPSPNNTA